MAAKREEIINYALRLIRCRSFSSFSYADIAREMQMTKAAVHYHFEKKDDLGIAVCELIEKKLFMSFEQCLHAIKEGKGHPWSFIESRVNTIATDEICPILSLQSDYENLSEQLKAKIKHLSLYEIELLGDLVKEYAPASKHDELVVSTLMSIKGALQYRRIVGEALFAETVAVVKKQFYTFLEDKVEN